eukprot:1157111-Pelagomonas_calceolata.AAC.9
MVPSDLEVKVKPDQPNIDGSEVMTTCMCAAELEALLAGRTLTCSGHFKKAMQQHHRRPRNVEKMRVGQQSKQHREIGKAVQIPFCQCMSCAYVSQGNRHAKAFMVQLLINMSFTL